MGFGDSHNSLLRRVPWLGPAAMRGRHVGWRPRARVNPEGFGVPRLAGLLPANQPAEARRILASGRVLWARHPSPLLAAQVPLAHREERTGNRC
jgi:hypothetical protein